MKALHIPGLDHLDLSYPKITICTSAAWATMSTLFEKYLYNDWEFLPFLVVLIVLDTFTGIWKSWQKRDFSSYAFGGVFTKAVLYAVVLFVIHNLSNFSNKEAVKALFSWVEQLGYAALIVREAISIFENIAVINPKLVPNFILKRLRGFNDTGKFEEAQPNPPSTVENTNQSFDPNNPFQ